MTTTPRMLITDLDNTLWDWFEAWYRSFSALLDGLVSISGGDREILEAQIKAVHQQRGTTEYSSLVREVPALVEFAGERDPFDVFNEALHAQNSVRKRVTKLYPEVLETLLALKKRGVRVVAYTESGAFWTEWRIRHTGLDGVIDVLYSSPDHDVAAGVDPKDLRGRHSPRYGLRLTQHRKVALGTLKPNREILLGIVSSHGLQPSEVAYLGDSLMKDIAMAQAAGVRDVYAAYGQAQKRPEYDLLRRVTHWTDGDVVREAALGVDGAGELTPSLSCFRSMSEILPVFDLPALELR